MLKMFRNHRLELYLKVSFLMIPVFLSATALAQVAGKGSIQGTVSDPSGAVVPQATVSIKDTATNTEFSTKADGSGLYNFPNIVPSTYTLTVAAPGFETYVKSGNVLEVGSSISLNVSMTVGRQEQTVEVQATGLALQTEDVSYKQTVDGQEIVELPLNGRQVTGLLYLTGAANNASGNDFTGSKYSYAGVSISIAGGQGNSSLWRLDGADNGDYMAGTNLPFPFPDAVGQFSVENSALGAQDGTHAGGMINTVTKSGTNTFHGDAFLFLRNNLIDATNYTNLPCTNGRTPPSCGKNTLHYAQYGGTIGGPVRIPKLYNGKDKLFFFAGFQYTRSKSASASSFAYVPTAANLAGDFTVEAGVPSNAPGTGPTIGTAPNPLCKSTLTQLVDPTTGNPVPGNRYPTPPTWSAQSLALLKFLPPVVPLADGSDICGHVQYSIPSENFDKQFITRIDYTLNQKDHLYGRYLLDSYQLPAFFSPTNILLTTNNGNPEERVQTGTIGEDHTFRNNLVNSAHVAILRRLNIRGYAPNAINACNLGVNITCAVSAGLQLGTGGNIGGLSAGGGGNSLAHFNDNTLAINDDVTWVLGKHQLVFGGEFVRNQLNISNAFQSNGTFSFGSGYSSYGPYGSQNQAALNGNYCSTCSSQPTQRGNGQLDFLEGALSGFGQSKQQQNALRSSLPAFYAQDVFHMTKRLTLVAGLRWNPFYQPIDVRNRGLNFNFADYVAGIHSTIYPTAPAGMLFYGDPGVPRTFTQSSPNQWDPNLGFTLDLYGNGKTVFRAGAEYIYDFPNNYTTQRNQQNPPFATTTGQSLNTYIPFSNPYSVPTLPANGGPGAVNNGTLFANPFPDGSAFVGVPTKGSACATSPATTPNCPIFGANGSYIVPVVKFHPAVYAQWTASIQQDFGKGWLVNLQYIGNKGNHEVWGDSLSPAILIPGFSSGVAGPSNCATTIAGVNYWLGEFPGSAAVPAAGAPCSTNVGSNETARRKLNLINPTQGGIIGGGGGSLQITSSGFSTYEALVLSVNHRLSSTFSLLSNYTWSKCLDLNESNGDQTGINGENPLNPKMDYGPCSFDYRHVANFVVVTKSKFHFNHRVENFLFNNWEFSGLSHISTGSPFSVTTGQDNDLVGNPGGDRASIIPGAPVYLHQTYRQGFAAGNNAYLNPAAFNFNLASYMTRPTSSVSLFGNTSRNQFVGPRSISLDGQVSRLWALHDSMNLTTRIEAYNLLNHPNFTEGNNSLTSGATFGTVNGVSNSARVFQGVVKFVF